MVADRSANAAWERLIKEHMRPSRLMAIATKLDKPTTEESTHILNCPKCTAWKCAYEMYQVDMQKG